MGVGKIDILNRFNINQNEYFEKPITSYKMVKLRARALIFILDYSLFAVLIYFTSEFIALFIDTIPDNIIYTLITFYSVIFIAIEYYFDGTIFKILFNIRSISVKHKKLGLHIYILKFIVLRPIALILAIIYLNFLTALILWVFGYQKIFFKFLNGEMDSIWYDNHINQIVTKIPSVNGKISAKETPSIL